MYVSLEFAVNKQNVVGDRMFAVFFVDENPASETGRVQSGALSETKVSLLLICGQLCPGKACMQATRKGHVDKVWFVIQSYVGR